MPKGIKVFYAGCNYKEITTGGQRRISEVLKYLEKKGMEVKFLETQDRPAPLIRKNFLLTNLWYIRITSKLIEEDNCILIEDYSQRFYLFMFNIFVGFNKKIKLVGLVNAFYFSYRKSTLKNLIDRMVSILFLKHLDMVIVSGEAVARQVLDMNIPSHKVKVCYPALREEFIKNVERPMIKSRDKIQLLFVGSIHPRKGLENLLQSLKFLNAQNLKLTIVGNTDNVPEYTKRLFKIINTLDIADRVDFVGQINDTKKLMEIYKSSDIFVLPSEEDPSPIALVEAMCFGLPIIATNVGGIPEWLEDGVNGILVPPKNSQVLANAILKLIQDIYLREKMGQKGYEKSFWFKRTWEDVGKEYYETIKSL
jgi:glycosyltransferase involved in cell wall biosynthesis